MGPALRSSPAEGQSSVAAPTVRGKRTPANDQFLHDLGELQNHAPLQPRAAMKPEKLSHQLRTVDTEHLRGRRRVLQLALGAAGCMGVISLYQMGVIRHLPEPPLPRLNADAVDASAEAYARLSTPDSVLGFASYAGTMVLAAMGGPDRARARPWLPLALGAKVAADAFQAGKLTIDQWAEHREFCSWCLLAAGLTFAALPAALPEARAALRTLASR